MKDVFFFAVVATITQPSFGVEIGQETLLVISSAQVSFTEYLRLRTCADTRLIYLGLPSTDLS